MRSRQATTALMLSLLASMSASTILSSWGDERDMAGVHWPSREEGDKDERPRRLMFWDHENMFGAVRGSARLKRRLMIGARKHDVSSIEKPVQGRVIGCAVASNCCLFAFPEISAFTHSL